MPESRPAFDQKEDRLRRVPDLSRRVRGALLFVVASAALCATAEPARACSYSSRTLQPLSETVPLSGPIIVAKTCFASAFSVEPGQAGDCPADPMEVRVNGRVVPGRVEVRQATRPIEPGELAVRTGGRDPRPFRIVYSVWTPDEELADGQRYQPVVFEEDWENEVGDPIAADAEARWERPEIASFEWSLSAVRLVEGEAHCCSYSDCTEACFAERELTAAALTWSGQGRDFEPERQAIFVYRLVREDSATEWVSLSDYRPRLLESLFVSSAREYCAELQQLNLINGETRSQQVCVDADPTTAYGEVGPTAFRDGELRSCYQGPPGARLRYCSDEFEEEQCQLPPAPITQAWCEAHAAGCPGFPGETGSESCPEVDWICERYLGHTSSVPPVDAGLGAVDETDETDQPAVLTIANDAAGCGCRFVAGRSRSGAAGLLLLGVAVVWLRRARSQAPRLRW